MNASPTISVCIAHYKGIDLITACIASIRAQGMADAIEMIVHDDASPDGSAGFIRARHPDVRIIESPNNVGFCVANNRMAELACGRYLLLLNNDAALLPGALATLLAAAEALSHPAILTLPQYDAATGELIDNGCRLDPFLNPIPNRELADTEVGTVHGACLWLPKELWDEIGGFPEWFGSVAEDLYFCCRARLAGYPVRGLGTSGYLHRVGLSFGGGKAVAGRLATTYRRRALSERNKTLAMIICHPTSFLIAVLPLHLGLIVVEGLLMSLLLRSARPWREIYSPILPQLWARRRAWMALRGCTQASRQVTLADWLAPFSWMPWKLLLLLRHGLPSIK